MRARFFCLSAVVTALLLPASAHVLAHHSFAAEFLTTEGKWTGTVTQLQFRTPHVHFYLDIKDASGKVVNWCFELPSPEQLQRRGLGRGSIKIGDRLTISGYLGKDNAPVAMTRTIELPDGRRVFTWDYEDFGPTKSDEVVVDAQGNRQSAK